MLDQTKFRLGPANVYIHEGSPLAAVLVGYVNNVSVSLTGHRQPLHGGQMGTSKADIVNTGGECKIELNFEEITLESWQRTLRGNTQSFKDDVTPTKRKLEFQSRAGQSMRALGTQMKIAPLIGGIETTNLEDILVIPVCVPTGEGATISYNSENQQVIHATFEGLPDSTTRDRMCYWGDDTVVDSVGPLGF
jgi:hypothetical protein